MDKLLCGSHKRCAGAGPLFGVNSATTYTPFTRLTPKKSPARHPLRAARRAIHQRGRYASSAEISTPSSFAACVARVITSETAWEARAKVELAMWL